MESIAVERSADQIPEEEQLRLATYRLLSRYLAAPADAALLELTAGFSGNESAFGRALDELAACAREADPERVRDEYTELFIGIGRGELLPYASYYLTGFLNERPLAELREDLERLGIARREGNPEPEDHIASLLEVMAGLVSGEFEGGLEVQRSFFTRHIDPWAGRFFADLEAAGSAWLYRPVGSLGRLFMEIERTAFAMTEGHGGSDAARSNGWV